MRCLDLIVTIIFAAQLVVATDRPNVVLIYADDVGYGDIGAYGAELIPTPNIDRLADEGLRFTDGHCSAGTCTPSRFSMLTGVHAFRSKVNIAPPNSPLKIPVDWITLPKVFKEAGYTTGLVGKWHLGLGEKGVGPDWNGALKPGPIELGFDSVFMMPTTNDRVPCVFVEGDRVVNLDPNDPIHVSDQSLSEVQVLGSTQYPDARSGNPKEFMQSVVAGHGRIGYMSGGKSALWNDETMSDVFVNEAKDFIEENKNHPFFLYFSSQDIHLPNTPNARFDGKTKLGKRGDAMVQFDWSVGQIIDALENHGLKENTLVIFTSDNGPTNHNDSHENTSKESEKAYQHDGSGIWRGGKYQIYEGANRVPLIVHWPARVEPGVSGALVSQVDFLASMSRFLGVELPEGAAGDSRDTLDAFLGQSDQGLPFFVSQSRGLAIRQGNWKFIQKVDAKYRRGWMSQYAPVEDALYDLETDPGETNNLIAQYPEKASEIRAILNQVKREPIRANFH
ncbi:MAG: sulfatase family protein [Opitutaceae bacterium]